MLTFLKTSLLALCLGTMVQAESGHHKILRKRAAAPNLPGIPGSNNLRKGNLAVGMIPSWNYAPKGPNNLTQINQILPKPVSILGTYYDIDPSDPAMNGLDEHIPEMLAQKGDIAVWNVAVGMPNLAYITPTVASTLAKKMAGYNAQGITVYLRFAWEMNGDWYSWSQQPSALLLNGNWSQMLSEPRKRLKLENMLWSPNSRYGAINDMKGGWTPYWPGASYVDVIGLSFYSYGGFNRENIAPASNFLSSMLKDFSNTFAIKYNKPILLSETAAAYTVNLDTMKPNTGKDSEVKIKSAWLGQLLSTANQKSYPYYRGFTWFEHLKDENASGNSPVRQEDFRCLMGNPAVRQSTLSQLGNGS